MTEQDSGGRGLTRAQIVLLRDAVECGGTWKFDAFVSCDGEASALATHDPTDTTLVMSGSPGRIELSELRDDLLCPIGWFGSAAELASFVAGPVLTRLLGC